MKRFAFAVFVLLAWVISYADISSKLNITEEDGVPSTYPYKLKVTNGSLTDNGDGTASLSTGGSGGGTITPSSVTITNGSLTLSNSSFRISGAGNDLLVYSTSTATLFLQNGNTEFGRASPIQFWNGNSFVGRYITIPFAVGASTQAQAYIVYDLGGDRRIGFADASGAFIASSDLNDKNFYVPFGIVAGSGTFLGPGDGGITFTIGTATFSVISSSFSPNVGSFAYATSSNSTVGYSTYTYVSSTGITISPPFDFNGVSTMTYTNVLLDVTGGGLSIPVRTAAQIQAAIPGNSRMGNIVNCSDCVTGRVFIGTGSVVGAWGVIYSTNTGAR